MRAAGADGNRRSVESHPDFAAVKNPRLEILSANADGGHHAARGAFFAEAEEEIAAARRAQVGRRDVPRLNPCLLENGAAGCNQVKVCARRGGGGGGGGFSWAGGGAGG